MQLVPTPIQHDLLAATADLIEGVKSGHIVGLAVVVELRGGNFFVDALGRITRRPWCARGWLKSLDDLLYEIGEQRRGRSTTQ
jgi:hypothetical protein